MRAPCRATRSSSSAIAALRSVFEAAMFPTHITSSEGAANSLTVSRATSGEKTLKAILAVSAPRMPSVPAYTAAVC